MTADSGASLSRHSRREPISSFLGLQDLGLRILVKASRSLRSLTLVRLHHSVVIVWSPAQIEARRSRVGSENLLLAVLARRHCGPLPFGIPADHTINLKVHTTDSGVLWRGSLRRV